MLCFNNISVSHQLTILQSEQFLTNNMFNTAKGKPTLLSAM